MGNSASGYVRAKALRRESFIRLERELRMLEPLIVFLRLSAESIRARTIAGRRRSGFYQYIQKFGSSEEELVQYFYEEQERMMELLTKSSLHHAVLDGEHGCERLQALFSSTVRTHFNLEEEGQKDGRTPPLSR
jgi:hypothetical protein